jgi:hypothetical protein
LHKSAAAAHADSVNREAGFSAEAISAGRSERLLSLLDQVERRG